MLCPLQDLPVGLSSSYQQVWVLDALPGALREHHSGNLRLRQDHPADLIPRLQEFPVPTESRATLQAYLVQSGFSERVASWVTSNLKPTQEDPRCTCFSYMSSSVVFFLSCCLLAPVLQNAAQIIVCALLRGFPDYQLHCTGSCQVLP